MISTKDICFIASQNSLPQIWYIFFHFNKPIKHFWYLKIYHFQNIYTIWIGRSTNMEFVSFNSFFRVIKTLTMHFIFYEWEEKVIMKCYARWIWARQCMHWRCPDAGWCYIFNYFLITFATVFLKKIVANKGALTILR